ncbi:hypothetical protein DAPPUDRAFT_301328 [Daphnia pulex]|uniref:Ig-like domain-containing protein n=1 Tax=Daphnia pulex TaxID=6669 RepID=E9G8S6_DAPPU|nr:hypothetical protein DAPPUDRAFT_301328 [Daphnia pulex]|eukprot:EFX84216.1 hypothetical protein DAPPUDRAFT_301328 [Daphnia pulex]
MAFSTYGSISLFLVVMVGCLCSMTATGQDVLSPSAERQSRQMFVSTPQFYNYYNPYAMMMPVVYPHQASAFPIYPAAAVTEGESDDEPIERGSRDTVNILPAATECLSSAAATEGMVPCLKTSGAGRGSLTIKLPAKDQVAVFGIVRSSSSRITLRCSEMTSVAAFTKTGQINAPSDTPRTETGVLQLVVTSTADNGLMKCTW